MTNLIKTRFFCYLLYVISTGSFAQIDQKQLFRDLEILASDSMEGRKTGTSGNDRARSFILQRIKEVGLEPFHNQYVHPFNFSSKGNDHQGKNIIAAIPGSDFLEKYIVISAHYDHVGIKSGEVYNGADDNASGIAALFAIGKHFKRQPPKHSFILALFDAEESGLKGSRNFVESNSLEVVLNINLDMISRSDNNEIYIAGTHQNPHLKQIIQQSTSNISGLNVLFGHDHPGTGGHDWSKSSDHGPFNEAGIPFLYFGVEDHEDYHKPTDDVEKISLTFYSSVVNMIIDVAESLDKNLQK